MNQLTRFTLLAILLLFGTISFAQDKKALALEKGLTAISLMDSGRIEESIKLLTEAQQLDPDKFDYPYEMAYAYYLKEDYKKAIEILEQTANHKDVSDVLFQLLGNAYDLIGKTEEAFAAYDQGLVKFPKSGKLYLEKGNVYWTQKEYGKALPLYEKGIEIDPKFPSNYYRAARIYMGSSEEVWGLIYGEIFMNLESNTKRTAEISKLLFDTYKSEIHIHKDSMRIDFCNNVINADDLLGSKKEFKMPFCMVFGTAMSLALINVERIDINSLDMIRRNFISTYYQMKHNKTHPNILYDYQKKLAEAGHIEAYNHWILMKGDEDGFDKWESENKAKWDSFVKWFTTDGNELVIDREHKFFRKQY